MINNYQGIGQYDDGVSCRHEEPSDSEAGRSGASGRWQEKRPPSIEGEEPHCLASTMIKTCDIMRTHCRHRGCGTDTWKSGSGILVKWHWYSSESGSGIV